LQSFKWGGGEEKGEERKHTPETPKLSVSIGTKAIQEREGKEMKKEGEREGSSYLDRSILALPR